MISRTVTVKVPASTSNLGSGFDTLGLAVKLHNVLRVSRVKGRGVILEDSAENWGREWLQEALEVAAKLFFRRARRKSFGLSASVRGEVPVARGLGASATVRVGFLAALNELAGTGLTRGHLLDLATELEGHPDNASPAIFGGFTVSGRVGGSVCCLSVPVSARLKCVTLIPTLGISTIEARKLLPETYSKEDAAHALNRSALLTAALSRGNFEALRGLFDDRIHQPFREPLIPRLSKVIAAGERAGALGGFLSGSGSAILCLTLDSPEKVARAMHRQWAESEVKILAVQNRGYHVVSSR